MQTDPPQPNSEAILAKSSALICNKLRREKKYEAKAHSKETALLERMLALYKDSKDGTDKSRIKWRGNRLTKKQLAEIGECQLALIDTMMKNEVPVSDLQPLA